MQKWLVASLVTGCLVAATARTGAAAPAGPGPGVVDPLETGPGYHRLQAVEDVSAGDVWSAGFREQNYRHLIKHYDGTSWNSVAGPYDGLGGSLHAFQSFGASDVWVVGNAGVPSFIGHWDGQRWTQVDSPSPGKYNNVLTGVSGVAPDDIWAVGESRIASSGRQIPVADHWDGTSWTQVPTPDIGPISLFWSVNAVSSDDVWAVGQTGAPVVERWDGQQWNLVDQPVDHGALTDVVGFTADDAWAVGYVSTGVPGGTQYAPLLEHWDGHGWSEVHGLRIGPLGVLSGLSGTGPDDIWAVGCTLRDEHDGHRTVIEHYDGSTWTRLPSPNPQPYATQCLTAVSAQSPSEAWAVGTYGYNDQTIGLAHNLFAHWDGTTWTWDRTPRR